MSRYSQPAEFAGFGFFGEYRTTDGKSWRGPCPRCGGTRRFLVFTDRPYPDWNYSCSLCTYRGKTARMVDPALQPTPEQLQRWEQDRQNREKEDQAQRDRAKETFVKNQLWLRAHEQLDQSAIDWWIGRGVPPDWQNYWHLGTTEQTFYRSTEEGWTEPILHRCYTIPKYQLNEQEPANIDLRLADPVPQRLGKYMGIPRLAPALWLAHPHQDELTKDGTIIVTEGSIKGMVAATHLPGTHQIIAVPAARSWVNLLELLGSGSLFDQVCVILDPDATAPAQDLVEEIGKKAKRLTLPVKLDDAFVQHGLTDTLFSELLRQARRQ